MDLTNSSAVVTGGASGLGLATVEALVARGVAVTIVDLPQSPGKDVASRLGDLVTFGPADVRDAAAVDAALDLAVGRAPLRTLVHCAGRGGTVRLVNRDGTPGDYDLYREIVDINLVGTFNVLRLAATRMSANEPVDGERGVCVLTASVAAWEGQIGQIPYASAKAGVVGMTLVAGAGPLEGADPGVLDRTRRVRHADPQPVLGRDQAGAGRPGAAPRSSRTAGGVRLDGDAHRRQPDAQRRDDPARRGDPDGAAVSAPVSTRVESGVLVVTIERPEARNAINTVTAEAIGAAMDRLDSETALVAGVITGAGGTFCAGMDLKAFLAGERPSIPRPRLRRGRRATAGEAAHRGGRGVCVGRRVRDRARLRHGGRRRERAVRPPEVKRGLVAAGGGLMRLLQEVPPGIAQEWALTGDLVDGPRAHTRWGWSTG